MVSSIFSIPLADYIKKFTINRPTDGIIPYAMNRCKYIRAVSKKRRNPMGLRRFLAPSARFERAAFRLGVPAHVSYRVVRDALKCP